MEVQCFMSANYPPTQPSCLPVLHVRLKSSPMFWIAEVSVVLFVVVNGVPSIGIQVMCGSGKIETQNILPVPSLPVPSIARQDGRKKSSSASSVLLSAIKYVGAALSAMLLVAS
jgi:hypothetical protein